MGETSRPVSGPPPAAELLIVDDEPCVRQVLTRWLEAEGYVCSQAADGEEAWGALRQRTFALLVTDISMPGMSGMELLERTKRCLPGVAVILLTGMDDRETAIRALRLGAYGYIIKPFGQTEVLINVANALRRRDSVHMSDQYEEQLEDEVRLRTADIRRTQEEIALRLVAASEFRDEETGAHIRRMGLYAAMLADAAGWNGSDAADMRMAAPMHDIGKIGTPDSILLKPGKLTDDEFSVMKRHTEIGAQMLQGSDVPLLRMAKDIAFCHHEKWDGSGYPQGLAGRSIPESARLVAVADVYDALVSERVYRTALPEEEAIAIMSAANSQHFDPAAFACFLQMLPELRRIREQTRDDAGA